MKKRIVLGIVRGLLLSSVLVRCASESKDTGSQTHWLALCDRQADCAGSFTCECGVCTKACSVDAACTGLERDAVCAGPGARAHAALCVSASSTGLCLPACGGGCTATEACVDGACVPRIVALDGGTCEAPRRLLYPEPGCPAKPVCAEPSFNTCLSSVCGCDGVTESGCGDWEKPWSHAGPCHADAGANEAAHDGG